MTTNEIDVVAKFLCKTYYPKQTGPKTGKETIKELNDRLDEFNKRFNTKIKTFNEADFRTIVQHIRDEELLNGYELIAFGKNGYMISEWMEDGQTQAESLIARAEAIMRTGKKMLMRLDKLKRKTGVVSTKVNYKDKKPYEGDLFDSL